MSDEPKCPACGHDDYGPITPGSRVMGCGRCDHTWHIDGGERNEPVQLPVGVSESVKRPNTEDLHTTLQFTISEMERQDRKWGADRRHTPDHWLVILSEETGEAAEA